MKFGEFDLACIALDKRVVREISKLNSSKAETQLPGAEIDWLFVLCEEKPDMKEVKCKISYAVCTVMVTNKTKNCCFQKLTRSHRYIATIWSSKLHIT